MKPSFTSVEIMDREIVAATARAGEGVVRTISAELPDSFEILDAAARVDAIREAFLQCEIIDKKFALVLPRRKAILREFFLPAGDPGELQDMISHQLTRELPVAPEEANCSYFTQAGENGQARVSLAAVPKEELGPILDAVRGAGFEPAHVYISCFGLPALGRNAVVALTNGHAEIVVSRDGAHYFSRSARIPGRSVETLAMEVERTLTSYQGRHPGEKIEEITLAGVGADAKKLAGELSELLSHPVGTALGPSFELKYANTCGVSLMAMENAARMPDVLHPPVVKRRFKFTLAHRVTALCGVILLFLLVGAHLFLEDRREYLVGLSGQLAELEPRAEVARETMNRIRFAREWGPERFSWVDWMDDLSRRIDHHSVVIQHLSVSEEGKVQITGKARNQRAVGDVRARLRESEYFRSTSVDKITSNNEKSPYRENFSLQGQLHGFDKKRKKRR